MHVYNLAFFFDIALKIKYEFSLKFFILFTLNIFAIQQNFFWYIALRLDIFVKDLLLAFLGIIKVLAVNSR